MIQDPFLAMFKFGGFFFFFLRLSLLESRSNTHLVTLTGNKLTVTLPRSQRTIESGGGPGKSLTKYRAPGLMNIARFSSG